MPRLPIDTTKLAHRAGPLAARLRTPAQARVADILERATQGGPTINIAATSGVLTAERAARAEDLSRETIQAQALAVAGGGDGGSGGGGYITQVGKILRDGTGTLGSATSTVGATVLSGTVNIPNDGKNYVLLAFADLGYIQTGGNYGAAQLKVGSKASGWVGGAGATWRGWGHMLVSDPLTFSSTPSVTALIEVKSSSGAVNFDGGRIDVFAVPEMGSGGGTWNGGDIILPTRLKNVTLSGRDSNDDQQWTISPTGRMDLEELFATRGLNIGADGIIIARNAGGTTTFQVTGATGNTLIEGSLTLDGGVIYRRADNTEVGQLTSAGLFYLRDTAATLRVVLDATSGNLNLRGADGVTNIALNGVNGSSRFLLAPTVGPAASPKRVLTEDDLGTGTGGLTTEQVDDRVAALIVAGSGITKVYDDTANTLTIAATGGGSGTRDYPITYVSATAPTEPRVGDFWLETSTPRPPSDDPHASLVVSATSPSSPSLGDLWYQP